MQEEKWLLKGEMSQWKPQANAGGADTKVLAWTVTVGNFSSDRIIGEDEGRPEDFRGKEEES